MIGVEGKYIFTFSIGDKKDFIIENDLVNFLLVEETGNVMPTFELIFKCEDEKILTYLNEGNNLNVSFGKNKDNMIDGSFRITRLIPTRSGESKYIIKVIGLYSALGYLKDNIDIKEGSGVEVISQVVSEYFETDFNISSSTDSQKWIQHNIPNKKFVDNVWMHSYIPDSFICVGITSDGRFVLRDMKLLAGDNYKYRFTVSPENDNDIYFDGDYVPDDQSGFINYYLGYGRQKHVYTLEDGTESDILEDTDILLSLTNKLSRSSDIDKRIASVGMQNDNVHENYWKAFYKNMQSLVIFDSTKITFSFINKFIPIKVLDLIMFNEKEINRNDASEFYSGKYFVKKVARSISNGTFSTTLQVCRESFGGTRGDLR